jgi:acyl carrier protein
MTDELQALRGYIRDEIGYKGDVGPDVDLLEEKILDSFSIVQMAVFVQDHFGLELEPEDLVRANLCKLSAILGMIQRKRAGKA